MIIPYLKTTGEIKTPIVTSSVPLTLIDIMGDEGKIYEQIYGYINIVDNKEIFLNINDYYVDVNTKELKKKPQTQEFSKIQYL